MSDAFWQNLPITIGAIASLVTLLYQIWSRRDAVKGREEIKCEVQAVQAVAVRSTEEVADAKKAGVREGHEQGIPIGVEQGINLASQPGSLRTDFDPGATDLKGYKP